MSDNAYRRQRGGTGKYLHQLTRIHCGSDLLRLQLFPDAKEVTESFAAFQAAMDSLTQHGWRLGDRDTLLVAVGDGSTPRTAATFAHRTRWNCVSVDPRMGEGWVAADRASRRVDRLTCYRSKIEDIDFEAERAVIVAVHSHAPLPASVAAVRASRVAVIAIPCCFPLELPTPPDEAYRDEGIWSPENEVKVWHEVEVQS